MKTLPALLNTHMQGGSTTLADLLKITRNDGAVYAFTSASDDVTIDDVLYLATQGLNISSIEMSAGLAVDNLELTTLDDGSTFSQFDVLSGKWNNADFVISRYNWQTPTDGVEVRMVGTIGQVRMLRGSVVAELRGLQQALQQPIGSITSKTCRARLGDTRCTKDLTNFTFTGTVTSAASQQVFTASFGEPTPGDDDYNSVVLALHMDGANGSTTFTDTGPTPKTVTAVGNAQISTAQSQFGGASGLFDGTGDYLTVPNSADFNFDAGDFTVECWVRVASIAQFQPIIGQTQDTVNGWLLDVSSTGYPRFVCMIGGVWGVLFTSAVQLAVNTWTHISVSRSGSSFKIFVSGTEHASATNANSITASAQTCKIGYHQTAALADRFYSGYIDDVRVTKGVARYTANFTPPVSTFYDSLPVSSAPADDYLSEGIVTWTGGVNSGLSVKVKSYASSVLTLSLPMLSTISADDTFSVVAGCQKRLEDCSDKFDNVLNFQGEPHLPGIDKLTAPA